MTSKNKKFNKQGYLLKITPTDIKNTKNNPKLQKILDKLLNAYKDFLIESSNSIIIQLEQLSKYVKNRQYHRN